jgi:uncharacterized protein (TIGR02246 family)
MDAEEEIRRVQSLYCQRLDDGDVEGYAALFSDNARLVMRSGTHTGRAGMKKFIEGIYANQPKGRRFKHMFVNPVIRIDGDRAEASTDVIVLQCLQESPWEIGAVGRHHDQLELSGGGWVFTEKRIDLTVFGFTEFVAPRETEKS